MSTFAGVFCSIRHRNCLRRRRHRPNVADLFHNFVDRAKEFSGNGGYLWVLTEEVRMKDGRQLPTSATHAFGADFRGEVGERNGGV
jgi:hypothetical protein